MSRKVKIPSPTWSNERLSAYLCDRCLKPLDEVKRGSCGARLDHRACYWYAVLKNKPFEEGYKRPSGGFMNRGSGTVDER